MASSSVETLLQEPSTSRFTIYPIHHPDIFECYTKAKSAFWVAEEVDLSKDVADWNDVLTDDERHFLENILAFFAGSDGIVTENLAARFLTEVKIPEAKAFYGFQIAMETIHGEMYSLMIDTFIRDEAKKLKLFDAINTIPCIRKKADWSLKWMDQAVPFAARLIAFAVVEGVFFSGAFCSIFWLKERGLMPGLCTSNEFISRDEASHTEFAVLLYSKIENRLSQEQVHDLVGEAVDIESEFIVDSVPCSMLGMNAGLMTQYIRFVADRLLAQLGYSKMYESKNPFDFMNRINLDQKTNFFEQRETNYQVGTGRSLDNKTFEILEDF
jgi:ribonucleotide reductase beta subunit family protein with ferritin-like domain